MESNTYVAEEKLQLQQNKQTSNDSVVVFRNAGVARQSKFIWRNADFAIQRGEFIAILGPNGAGKSTMLHSILGLLRISEGDIQVLGEPPRKGNFAIGYTPQRRAIDPDIHIRARDFVGLGYDGHHWGIPAPAFGAIFGKTKSQRETAISAALDIVDARHLQYKNIGEMSGGEQQRLYIAHALVRKPQLLLLDEPLEGLDLQSQHSVSTLLHDISHMTNTAILMVAHDLNPIAPYIDRVLFVAHGAVRIGTTDELVTSEQLSQIYQTKVEVLRDAHNNPVVIGAVDTTYAHHAAE